MTGTFQESQSFSQLAVLILSGIGNGGLLFYLFKRMLKKQDTQQETFNQLLQSITYLQGELRLVKEEASRGLVELALSISKSYITDKICAECNNRNSSMIKTANESHEKDLSEIYERLRMVESGQKVDAAKLESLNKEMEERNRQCKKLCWTQFSTQ